jgi:hypothetical protein
LYSSLYLRVLQRSGLEDTIATFTTIISLDRICRRLKMKFTISVTDGHGGEAMQSITTDIQTKTRERLT